MSPRPSGTSRSTGVPSFTQGRNAVFGPGHQLPLDFDSDELDTDSALAAIGAGRRLSGEGLERLGESGGFAEAILKLLEANGWSILRPGAFAGDGIFLIATRDWRQARGTGKDLGQATVALLSDISAYYGVRQVEVA